MLKFCKEFELLDGKDRVTPSMHLHVHIKDCILDYGPIYSFWLLSFEKYNGKIGSLPTNKRNIESQIMGQFYCQNLILCLDKPQQYKGYFADIFNDFDRISSQMGTLNDI